MDVRKSLAKALLTSVALTTTYFAETKKVMFFWFFLCVFFKKKAVSQAIECYKQICVSTIQI